MKRPSLYVSWTVWRHVPQGISHVKTVIKLILKKYHKIKTCFLVFEYNIFSLRVKLCGCKDFLSESKVIPCKCCYCYASSFLWLPISFKLALYQCIQKISVLPFHSRYIVVAQGDLISWKGGKSWAFFNLPVMIGNYKTTSPWPV